MRKGLLLAAVAAASVGVCAAQAPRAGQTTAGNANANQNAAGAQGRAAMNDRLFALATAVNDHAEIALGRLAESRASSDAVKKFARRMADEHGQSSQQLMRLATAKKIALPEGPEIKDQAAAAALACCSGEKFDREYIKNQVAAHACAVQLFEAESEHGQDADLKAMATKLLPNLKDHYRMAKEMMHEENDERSTTTTKSANPGR